MNIELSRRDYLTLLEILDIADYALHSYHDDDPADRKKYRDFAQRILALAPKFGCEKLVEFEASSRNYFPSSFFEKTSPSTDYIEEFEDDCFWNQLVERFAERDLQREFGEKKLSAMPPEVLQPKRDALEQKYWEEFENHGLDRVEVLRLPTGSDDFGVPLNG